VTPDGPARLTNRLPRDEDAERHTRAAEQTASDADQTLSELDQSASDADQATADSDRGASEHDQELSSADQRASDKEHQATARELAEDPGGDPATRRVHEASQRKREAATAQRSTVAALRSQTTADRLDAADRRDEASRLRDDTAEVRDHAADARDRLAEPFEPVGPAAEARVWAAADRERAAADRVRAASDREQAAVDRRHADEVLAEAHLDELTGTYRRGLGTLALQREIDRARHSSGRLVLAFIDVDGLKEINDHEGHAAGDALLIDVAAAIGAHLRSYDPIVRFGGDEFVCACSDFELPSARRRFEEIQAVLHRKRESCSVSVGFAELQKDDTLEDLVARGDAALYDARDCKRGHRSANGRQPRSA
jgi:diguanylate cyclase (GGDEF)-like protein